MEIWMQAWTRKEHKETKSLPEVIAMKPNTPLRSQTLSTHPGEHVAKALRVANQMVENLGNEDHHVTVRFLTGLCFQGKCSIPYNFYES